MNRNRKITMLFVSLLLFAMLILGFNFYTKVSYDAPVRETSLKLDLVAKAQLASDTTFSEVLEKTSRVAQELEGLSTKLPSPSPNGKAAESTVREYLEAAISYVHALNNMYQSQLQLFALQKKLEEAIKTQGANYTMHCSPTLSTSALGRCYIDASAQMERDRSNFTSLTSTFESKVAQMRAALILLAEKQTAVKNVVSSGVITSDGPLQRVISQNE